MMPLIYENLSTQPWYNASVFLGESMFPSVHGVGDTMPPQAAPYDFNGLRPKAIHTQGLIAPAQI
jgi:hypothetical protein